MTAPGCALGTAPIIEDPIASSAQQARERDFLAKVTPPTDFEEMPG